MRYQGTLEEVETIIAHVLAKAKCMVIKPLPKESAFATGHLLVVTGKDWFAFDLYMRVDRRENANYSNFIELPRQAVPRLCNISPDIAQTINKMKPIQKPGDIVQSYTGTPVIVPTQK